MNSLQEMCFIKSRVIQVCVKHLINHKHFKFNLIIVLPATTFVNNSDLEQHPIRVDIRLNE